MAGERLDLDPIGEDAANSPLALVDPDNGVTLLTHAYPPPSLDQQWAPSADTEGDPLVENRYQNREISAKLRVAEPLDAAGTNLCTNPKAAIDTTGWTNTSLTTFERVSLIGAASGQVDNLAAETGFRCVADAAADRARHDVAVTSGLVYRFSAWVYIVSGAASGVFLQVRNAADTPQANSTVLTTGGVWTRLDVSVTAAATETYRFTGRTSSGGAVDWYFTGAMIQQSSSLDTYFDGDTIGCAWSGTHHASTSTRPAAGGDRFAAMLTDIQKKVGKVVQEKGSGTLRRVTPAGDPLTFDLLGASIDEEFGYSYIHSRRTEGELTFTAKPFGRGAPEIKADHAETTLPVCIGVDTAIKGDALALGKLVIDEDSGNDQWWLVWGIQSRYYDSSADAALFYEAEGRTAQGGSAAAVGAAGASGGGSNVMRNTDLTTTYLSILSTQATGGGNHLRHIGSFRVFARLYRPTGNTGAVSVALEWGEGDFRRFTQNAETTYEADEREGVFTIADLGQIHLTKVTQGTQRWEGRILAKSTVVGDEIDVDHFFLVPVDEGSAAAAAAAAAAAPTTFSARDEFNQSAGALTGKQAPIPTGAGGVWAGAGDADDFTVETTGKTVVRTTAGDLTDVQGRYAIPTTLSMTATAVQVSAKTTSTVLGAVRSYQGVLARYVDANNWLMAVFNSAGALNPASSDPRSLYLIKRVGGGGSTTIGSSYIGDTIDRHSYFTVRLTVDASGRCAAWIYQSGSSPDEPAILVSDAVLAPGGALESGRPGFYDSLTATSATRNYDNFAAWVPPADAAIFASQSAEIRHDRVVREDSGGTLWQEPSSYKGDYLLVPPAGAEDRSLRTIVKAVRNNPETMSDPGIDDLSYRLTVTPRYRQVPEP